MLRELFATEPDQEFVRASHDASRGNPFLLTELARALEADGRAPDVAACARIRDVRPEAIARNALVRLRQLGPAAHRVARAVATLGDDAAIRHVATLADLPDDDAADAVDRLVAAGILAAGRTVRYLHPLTRAVVYDDLGQAGRSRLHKRAAAMLADEQAEPERVASHLLLTEPAADEQVVDRLLAAASRAQRQGAVEAVGAYMRRALAEPPPAQSLPSILLELGRAESAAAQPGAAYHLREAFCARDRRRHAGRHRRGRGAVPAVGRAHDGDARALRRGDRRGRRARPRARAAARRAVRRRRDARPGRGAPRGRPHAAGRRGAGGRLLRRADDALPARVPPDAALGGRGAGGRAGSAGAGRGARSSPSAASCRTSSSGR